MAPSAGSTRAGAAARLGGWKRLSRLRPGHLIAALRCLLWIGVSQAILGTAGFRRLSSLLRYERVEPVERTQGEAAAVPRDSARAISTTLRMLDLPGLRVSCLPRSVVIERALAARGIAGELVIGVDTSQGFRAHAWVEVDGMVVGHGESSVWKPLARFAARGRRR